MREVGGGAGSTSHDSVTAAALGLLLHGDAVGAGGPINVLSICYTRGRTRLHHSRHRDAPLASGSDLFSFALTSSRGFQPAGSTVP